MSKGRKRKSVKRRSVNRSLDGGGIEHCMNPWNGKCRNTDIQLYIFYRNRKRPICRSCWEEIVKQGYSWDSLSKRE